MSNEGIPFTFSEAARFIEALARASRSNKVMISLTFTPYEDDVIGVATVEPVKEEG
jgi:hypothetical protein